MKKNKKNLLKILLIIVIFIIIYSIIKNTYSKYLTMQDSQTNTNISKWHILVNKQDITKNSDFSGVLKLQLDDNPNIADDLIAPTVTGSVDVELESTGTDLPFNYELKVSDGLPTDSIYQTTTDHNWPSGNAKYNIYSVDIHFENYDYPGPINSNYVEYPDGSWGPPYGFTFELSFTMPKQFSFENSNIWIGGVRQEGDQLIIDTEFWAWTWDAEKKCNVFTQTLQLAYEKDYDPTSNSFTDGASFNGKHMINSILPDFKIYAYTLNDSEIIYLAPEQTVITGTVTPPADINEEVINKLKLYVIWYDGEDNIFDNSKDVEVSKLEDSWGSISLDLKVTQIE